VKGEGNQQDYGMRVYDPRIGKFLSVDPLTEKYPWYTPYQFAGNKPIWATDLDGAEENPSNLGPYPSSQLPNSYMNPANRVDMNGAPSHVTASNNSRVRVATTYTKPLGAPRNYLYYWYELLQMRPEAFSPANRAKLANGAAPTVDAQWIEANPTHAGFEKDILIHHHEMQGNVATALPKTVHEQWTKDLHPLKYPKTKSINGLGLSINLLSVAIELFSKDPHTMWNSTFGNGAHIGQIYINPDGGYYQVLKEDNYYDKDGNREKTTRLLEFYKSYGKDKDGNYFGHEATGQKIIITDYKKDKTTNAEII
jgi:hypothetical protein